MEIDILKNILPSKFLEVLEKAGISTPRQVILLSPWDIKKATKLLDDDILLLKRTVSRYCCPISSTCDNLQDESLKIQTGCAGIDNILGGGFRAGIITEIYGESGSGKTQIAMQTAAHCGMHGSVIICTEDIFPVKRFQQICKINKHNSVTDCGNNVFIEHVTEAHELLGCIRVRLPLLLSKRRISSIIIDSVAAPFRSEYTNFVQRAKELRELGNILLNIAQEHNLAVICINQVTSAFDGSDNVLPTLGLVWSNMISCRLKLRKLPETIEISDCQQNVNLRELTVMYAPDLASGRSTNLLISTNGVEDVK